MFFPEAFTTRICTYILIAKILFFHSVFFRQNLSCTLERSKKLVLELSCSCETLFHILLPSINSCFKLWMELTIIAVRNCCTCSEVCKYHTIDFYQKCAWSLQKPVSICLLRFHWCKCWEAQFHLCVRNWFLSGGKITLHVPPIVDEKDLFSDCFVWKEKDAICSFRNFKSFWVFVVNISRSNSFV